MKLILVAHCFEAVLFRYPTDVGFGLQKIYNLQKYIEDYHKESHVVPGMDKEAIIDFWKARRFKEASIFVNDNTFPFYYCYDFIDNIKSIEVKGIGQRGPVNSLYELNENDYERDRCIETICYVIGEVIKTPSAFKNLGCRAFKNSSCLLIAGHPLEWVEILTDRQFFEKYRKTDIVPVSVYAKLLDKPVNPEENPELLNAIATIERIDPILAQEREIGKQGADKEDGPANDQEPVGEMVDPLADSPTLAVKAKKTTGKPRRGRLPLKIDDPQKAEKYDWIMDEKKRNPALTRKQLCSKLKIEESCLKAAECYKRRQKQ